MCVCVRAHVRNACMCHLRNFFPNWIFFPLTLYSLVIFYTYYFVLFLSAFVYDLEISHSSSHSIFTLHILSFPLYIISNFHTLLYNLPLVLSKARILITQPAQSGNGSFHQGIHWNCTDCMIFSIDLLCLANWCSLHVRISQKFPISFIGQVEIW